MSNWREKSIQNLMSADLLIGEGFYSASIHCSYYSNIQLILHLLQKKFPSLDEFDKYQRKGFKKNKGFHNWIINDVVKNLFKINNEDFRYVSNNIRKLKKLRIEADYKDIIFDESKANVAKNYALHINKILMKLFE